MRIIYEDCDFRQNIMVSKNKIQCSYLLTIVDLRRFYSTCPRCMLPPPFRVINNASIWYTFMWRTSGKYNKICLFIVALHHSNSISPWDERGKELFYVIYMKSFFPKRVRRQSKILCCNAKFRDQVLEKISL